MRRGGPEGSTEGTVGIVRTKRVSEMHPIRAWMGVSQLTPSCSQNALDGQRLIGNSGKMKTAWHHTLDSKCVLIPSGGPTEMHSSLSFPM